MSRSSIRNRLFFVIAAMALVSSTAIAFAFLATEAERNHLRVDGQAVANLYDKTVRLSTAIRDQEAAVDDYLLARAPDARARYLTAVGTESQLEARMRELDLQLEEYPAVDTSLATLASETQTWREVFAQPAIAALDSGAQAEVSRMILQVATDQDLTLSGVETLVVDIATAQTDIARRDDALTQTRANAVGFGVLVMILTAAASFLLARRWVTAPLNRLLATAGLVEAGESVPFVSERDDEIGRLGHALESMRHALQNDVDRSSILNRFTEVTTFHAARPPVRWSSVAKVRATWYGE